MLGFFRKGFYNFPELYSYLLVRSKFMVSWDFRSFFIFIPRVFVEFSFAAALMLLLMSYSDMVRVKLSKESLKRESGFLDKAFCNSSNLFKVSLVRVLDFWVFWYSDWRVLSNDSDSFILILDNFDWLCKLWLFWS